MTDRTHTSTLALDGAKLMLGPEDARALTEWLAALKV